MLITYKILLKVSGKMNLAFPGKPPLLISITFNLCDVYFNRRFVSHSIIVLPIKCPVKQCSYFVSKCVKCGFILFVHFSDN